MPTISISDSGFGGGLSGLSIGSGDVLDLPGLLDLGDAENDQLSLTIAVDRGSFSITDDVGFTASYQAYSFRQGSASEIENQYQNSDWSYQSLLASGVATVTYTLTDSEDTIMGTLYTIDVV